MGNRSVSKKWSARVDLNHRSPASKAGRDGQTPLRTDMVHTAGLEPAPSRFVAGGFIQLSYVCAFNGESSFRSWLPGQDSNLDRPVNSRVSCHWTTGEQDVVEHFGLEPNPIFLQGRPAPLRVPRMELVPGVGFEPTSPRLQRGAFTRLASQASAVSGVLNWSGRRDSNSRLCVGAAGLYL